MRQAIVVAALSLLPLIAASADPYKNIPAKNKRVFAATCLSMPPPKGSGLWMVDTNLKWPNGSTLKVQFFDGSNELQDRVISTASEWSNYCNIKFARADSGDIRITFAKPGYASLIGRQAKTRSKTDETMILGFGLPLSDDEFRRVVLHEFGHALGFGHEHQSPLAKIPWNVPAVMSFYGGPPNNWDVSKIERNVLGKESLQPDAQASGKFDPKSIMMYPIPSTLTLGGFSSDWNTSLSETDKQFAAKMYPK